MNQQQLTGVVNSVGSLPTESPLANDLSIPHAVRYALLTSATAVLSAVGPAYAQEQQEAEPAADDTAPQEVVVTGSRIRRVELETASPVFVLDASQIQSSGVSNVGELIQRVPAIAGAATNPQVNNGGGTGESNVELRGLGAQRTLVLLNGRRVGISGRNGTVSAVDINMIPLNLVERVEVLKEGAGAIYGSDAIAGVVNFITRTEWDGAELNLEYGRTAENDGERRTVSAQWGNTTDKLSVMFGGTYSDQEEVGAGDRDFSAFALYLYGGVVTAGGSSRTPTGRIFLDETLTGQFGCTDVTRIAGTTGSSLSDYRCFEGTDLYNYQPFNLLMTPQERVSFFTLANYNINDSIETYAEVLYTRTRSGYAIASLPFDSLQDDVIISADNIYNPFGIDFGGGEGANPNAVWRLEALGNRRSDVATDQMLTNFGLRGSLFQTEWQWDLNAGFGRMDQDTTTKGYLFKSRLQAALGPSFLADDGTPTCGTPDAPITGCIPLNVFNLDADQAAALGEISTNYQNDGSFDSRGFSFNLNGSLLKLPAGDLSMAFGLEHRKEEGRFTTDILTRGVPPLFTTCLLAQETCTGDSYADLSVKEAYTEFFVPILADKPAVKALNVSAGIRYSDYDRETIGSSTNAQFKVEYRPISDVLIRGSFAEVFRAPTILDLSLAPTQTASTFNDPCVSLTEAAVAANPNLGLACVGVPRDGTFFQPNSQITGLYLGDQNLKPETGDVTTFGIVYDSSQIRGLSATVDFWRYKIDDLITAIDVNFAADQCVQTGLPQFCDLIFRFTDPANAGIINVFLQPNVNLGSLETDGVDFGVRYVTQNTPWGSFRASLDLTRINSYENIPAPGAAPIEVAGTYDRQFGNFAEWRGLLGIGWTMRGFDALVTARYVGSLELPDPDGAIDLPPLQLPSITYVDLTLGYTLPTNTRIQLGAINLTDKQPPLLYQNNVTNANTDVSTYDLLGRRWFLGVTQKF